MKSPLLQFKGRSSLPRSGVFSERRGFPLTDYHYQATAEAPLTATSLSSGVRTTAHVAEMRSFRKLSLAAVAGESRWPVGVEALVFALVVGVAAWPLASLVILMAQTGYGW